jgi:prevent-host-death family protein
MSLKTNVKPITYLKNHTADLVRSVAADGGPVLVTQNGEAKVVVMSVEAYDHLRASLALLKLLAGGEDDVAAGRTVGQQEAFRRARGALKRAAGRG